MKNLLKNPFFHLFLVFVGLLSLQLYSIASAQWAPPSDVPPNANVSSPVDTSAIPQVKSGDFAASEDGSFSATGNVNAGVILYSHYGTIAMRQGGNLSANLYLSPGGLNINSNNSLGLINLGLSMGVVLPGIKGDNLPAKTTPGTIVYDTTEKTLKIFDGTAWKAAAGSGGTGAGVGWALASNTLYNTNSGNVGIGDNNPRAKLTVSSTPAASGNGSIGEIAEIYDSSASGSNTTFGGLALASNPGYDFIVGKKTVNNDTFFQIRRQDGKEFMTVDQNGNVGIGTANPQGILDVAGDKDIYLKSNTESGGVFIGANGLVNLNVRGNVNLEQRFGTVKEYSMGDFSRDLVISYNTTPTISQWSTVFRDNRLSCDSDLLHEDCSKNSYPDDNSGAATKYDLFVLVEGPVGFNCGVPPNGSSDPRCKFTLAARNFNLGVSPGGNINARGGLFSNYVGIGTANPSEALEVSGNPAHIRITNIVGNPELQLQYGTNSGDHWGIYADKVSGDLRFWANGAIRFLLSNTGKLIASELDSLGDINATGNASISGSLSVGQNNSTLMHPFSVKTFDLGLTQGVLTDIPNTVKGAWIITLNSSKNDYPAAIYACTKGAAGAQNGGCSAISSSAGFPASCEGDGTPTLSVPKWDAGKNVQVKLDGTQSCTLHFTVTLLNFGN